jgi:hypothetical protein
VTLYDALNVKNALLKSLCYVMEYILFSGIVYSKTISEKKIMAIQRIFVSYHSEYEMH